MTNYSDEEKMVRVSFFRIRERGFKWYADEAVEFGPWRAGTNGGADIFTAFEQSLVKHLGKENGKVRFGGMLAVCLDPYHEHAHPIMLVVPERAS